MEKGQAYMAIPDFQSIMLPLLRLMVDGQTYRMRDLVNMLADEFELSAEERSQLLPSGRDLSFRNRVAWARTYLSKAALLVRMGHGQYRISARGENVLAQSPKRIDIALLNQFPEFREFRQPNEKSDNGDRSVPAVEESRTPFELLDQSYKDLRTQLARELLNEVKASPPSFFEKVVVDLLVAMGYGGSHSDAAQAVGRSGDGGIDGIIKEDKLGLDAVYIQAKRWENVVGRPLVQGFAGSLEGQRARKGVMITTSVFTHSAHEYVGLIEKRIVLIDGEQLAELMIDYGIGVSEVATYQVYRLDLDYFADE
jgi:restriction system protein